jgi:isopentenyl-diphosphate delta-isomerase
MTDRVVLVNDADRPQGTADKLEAHVEGWLHRAFSVFVFDTDDHLLLQQRHPDKYHSGGLWSNTCCSHPRPNEPVADAARRRMQEEMGFVCPVEHMFGFQYEAQVTDTLTEHEYDHVFIGRVSARFEVHPNPTEVSDWTWIDVPSLRTRMDAEPEVFTVWFRLLLDRVLDALPAAPTPS